VALEIGQMVSCAPLLAPGRMRHRRQLSSHRFRLLGKWGLFCPQNFAHGQFAHTKKANLACTCLLTNMISEDLGDFCGQNLWAK
jgi:hypothetical protein